MQNFLRANSKARFDTFIFSPHRGGVARRMPMNGRTYLRLRRLDVTSSP
jgi:hypothetical protein